VVPHTTSIRAFHAKTLKNKNQINARTIVNRDPLQVATNTVANSLLGLFRGVSITSLIMQAEFYSLAEIAVPRTGAAATVCVAHTSIGLHWRLKVSGGADNLHACTFCAFSMASWSVA